MKKIYKWIGNHAKAMLWCGYVLALAGGLIGWKACLLSTLYFAVVIAIEEIGDTVGWDKEE